MPLHIKKETQMTCDYCSADFYGFTQNGDVITDDIFGEGINTEDILFDSQVQEIFDLLDSKFEKKWFGYVKDLDKNGWKITDTRNISLGEAELIHKKELTPKAFSQKLSLEN